MKRKYRKSRDNPTALENNPSVYGCQQNLFELEPITQPPKAESKSADSYVFDIVDALSAPILTFSHSWADTIPKRLLDIIQVARLKALMQQENTATYAECVVYIYTRTLEAPMDSDWTDIYTHVTCRTLQEWFGEDHWNNVKAHKELSNWLLSKLNDLRCHIYDKRRQILKGRLREREKTDRQTTKIDNNQKESQQQNLPLTG